MAQAPYPIDEASNVKDMMRNFQMAMDDLYQNRLGGANVGDVFATDVEDVLTLRIAGEGLAKMNGYLLVRGDGSQGIVIGANGVAVKLKANLGLTVDASGLYVLLDPAGGLTCSSAGLAASSSSLTKATGTDIITGTDDTKYVTPKAIKDARLDGNITISGAATSVVVTDSKVKTTSIIVASFATNNATGQVKNVVAANGSFTINVVAPTGASSINYSGVY